MEERTLDCLGEACPVPLVKAQKEMEKMNVGDVLIVTIDHSCAMKNVPDWGPGKLATMWRSKKYLMGSGISPLVNALPFAFWSSPFLTWYLNRRYVVVKAKIYISPYQRKNENPGMTSG